MAAQTPSQSCIICSTPRTGSTLLCSLLASTGIAGQPQSYFRQEDTQMWANRWGVPASTDGSIDFAAFLDGVLTAGTSSNTVFSARIMWGSMEYLVGNLIASGMVQPGRDDHVLRQAFGPTRYIWLQRQDTLAQAVSWAKAEQTRVWHRLDGQATPETITEPTYDFVQIHVLMETIREHNAAWGNWFTKNSITPLSLTYEALDADAADVVGQILRYLDLDREEARTISSRNIRLADGLSLDWMARYRRDLASRQTSA